MLTYFVPSHGGGRGGWWVVEDGWLRDLDLGVIAVCYTPWMSLRRQGRRLEEFWLEYAVYNVNIISAIALQHWKEVQSRHSVSY